ncbi:hypothetical protein BGZ94_003783 [Podila epigama]|nr:hypothetical protein BGZ94_003783 [Podila epigama]
MDNSSLAKVSLDSLMSHLLDIAPTANTPKKFKRVRGQVAQSQPQPQQQPQATAQPQSTTPSTPASSSSNNTPAIVTTNTSSTSSLNNKTESTPSLNNKTKSTPSSDNKTESTPSIQAHAPKQSTPGSGQKKRPFRSTNKRPTVAPDVAAAAAAVAAGSVPSTSFIPDQIKPQGSGPAAEATSTPQTANKKKRKNRQKKKGATQQPSETSEPSTLHEDTPNKKHKKSPKPTTSQRPGPRNNTARFSRSTDPQRIARNLDARPELVGLNQNDEDFSTLLLQHVEFTNRELQRDLEEQTKKMMQEQMQQAALLAQQAKAAEATSMISTSTNPTADVSTLTTLLSQNQGQAQSQGENKEQNQGQSQEQSQESSQGQATKQSESTRKPKEFIPRKPCVYFLKGTCRKKVCTFRHDINDIPPEEREAAAAAAAAAAELALAMKAESRSKRGVCKYEKTGSCTKGDACLFSHNLKEEPCLHYHLKGICTQGVDCRFSHDPITDEQHQNLVAAEQAKKLPVSKVAEASLQMAEVSHGTQGLTL